jgi:hypothetical protein
MATFRFCVGDHGIARGRSFPAGYSTGRGFPGEGLPVRLTLPLDNEKGFVDTEIAVARPAILAISHEGYGEIRWLNVIEEP